jgi:hypothetical protein
MNGNVKNSKQSWSGTVVFPFWYFVFCSFEFVSGFDFRISDFRVSGVGSKYGAFFPNFKLPSLMTELMRRGTSVPRWKNATLSDKDRYSGI